MIEVKVYCKHCGKVFWEGTLIQWGFEMQSPIPPRWANEAYTHTGKLSDVIVHYPSGDVPFDFSVPRVNR